MRIDFAAHFNNFASSEAVQRAMAAYIAWMENLPLFDEAIELGWTDRPELERMRANMRQWSEHPDAFLALGQCRAVGRKP